MDGCNGLLAVESITIETCLKFLFMFLCISGLCVEYQSCFEFHDLAAHKISTSLDLCVKSYGPNSVPRPVEKQTGQRGRNCIFLPP